MLALGLEKFSELFVLEVLLRLLRKVRGNKMHGFCSLVVHFKEDQVMQWLSLRSLVVQFMNTEETPEMQAMWVHIEICFDKFPFLLDGWQDKLRNVIYTKVICIICKNNIIYKPIPKTKKKTKQGLEWKGVEVYTFWGCWFLQTEGLHWAYRNR